MSLFIACSYKEEHELGVMNRSGLGLGLAKMLGNRVCYFSDKCGSLWTKTLPGTSLKTLLISSLGLSVVIGVCWLLVRD